MVIDPDQPGDAPDACARTQAPWRAWRLGVRPLLPSSSHAPAWEHVRALCVQCQDRTRSARTAFPCFRVGMRRQCDSLAGIP